MARRLDEQDNLDFFTEKYARPRSDAKRQIERAVLDDEVGLNGYTTVEQAPALADHLSLETRSQGLLDWIHVKRLIVEIGNPVWYRLHYRVCKRLGDPI